MTYPVNPKSFWYSQDEHGTYTVGSGDVQLAVGLPLEIARLWVASPTMLEALQSLANSTEDRESLRLLLEVIKAAK